MKQTIYILIMALTYALISGLVMGRLSRDVLADSSDKPVCWQMRDRYLKTGEGWQSECGPLPDSLFDLKLKKDCERTIKKILDRPGALMNSDWNWAPEEKCWALWPEGSYQ